MDYPEPNYEPTIKEKQLEVLKAVIEDNCSIEQTFHKGDFIRVLRKNEGTCAFCVEPVIMDSLSIQGLMRFTADDHPNNNFFRVRSYHAVEPQASEFLARYKHLLN